MANKHYNTKDNDSQDTVNEPAVAYQTKNVENCTNSVTGHKQKSTYHYFLDKINEQKRLIAEGKIEKPKPVNCFTSEDWKACKNGISIEEYALKRGIAL